MNSRAWIIVLFLVLALLTAISGYLRSSRGSSRPAPRMRKAEPALVSASDQRRPGIPRSKRDDLPPAGKAVQTSAMDSVMVQELVTSLEHAAVTKDRALVDSLQKGLKKTPDESIKAISKRIEEISDLQAKNVLEETLAQLK